MQSRSEQHAVLESVEPAGPHDKALYEAGKKMLVDSLDVTRDFCKFMTTTALGAIPTFIALLKFVLPKDYSLLKSEEWIFLVAPLAFLFAAVLFVAALLPTQIDVCLDYPDEIEQARVKLLRRRSRLSRPGFGLFCLAVIVASWQLVDRLA